MLKNGLLPRLAGRGYLFTPNRSDWAICSIPWKFVEYWHNPIHCKLVLFTDIPNQGHCMSTWRLGCTGSAAEGAS